MEELIRAQASTARQIGRMQWILLSALAANLLMLSGVWQRVNSLRSQVTTMQSVLPGMAKQVIDGKIEELTPQLNARIGRIEAAAGKMDSAMANLDRQFQQAENRLAGRIQQQVPKILDAYVGQKMREVSQKAKPQ